MIRIAAAALAFAFVAGPGALEDAITGATEKIGPALQAAALADKGSKDQKPHIEAVKGALDLLKGVAKEGEKDERFLSLWNKVVTLGEYHGVKGLPEYRTQDVTLPAYPIRGRIPVGRGWWMGAPKDDMDGQLCGEILRNISDTRVIRQVRVWVYRWDTVYSGTGGENAKGLAEKDMNADRGGMKKVTFRSQRVVTARLSAGFPKTNFYEIVGETDGGPIRIRNYYVKGSTTTYNFEVREFRRTDTADSPFVKWQIAETDPELASILASLEDVAPKKK